jgi:glycosyltransferase involved in cell wall biosynthesis
VESNVPLVSIIIPTYNRKHMLKEAIESLFDQTYPKDEYEIIVCDDGSTDGTEFLVKEMMKNSLYPLRYFKQENQGPAVARNLGINNARGEIIGFTDDDCIPSSTWIEKAIPNFENIDVIGVMGCVLPLGDIKKKWYNSVHTFKITEKDIFYGTGNIFYRKQTLLEVGGFDSEFKILEDLDMADRILKKGYKIDFNKDVMVHHRVMYRSPLAHLRSLKRYEFVPLYNKRHPERKKKLPLGFIQNKKHIYPVFITLTLAAFATTNYFYTEIFFLFAALSYLWAHVLIDKNIKKYPLRIFLFPKHFIPDVVRMYYAIRGSIKYRCFVL